MPSSHAASAPNAVAAVSSLGQLAARGALAMVFGQIGRIVVQFGGVLVLARVLSPKDYGVFAMVTAIIGFGELLQDFGLSSAAIQAPVVTRAQQVNLFWINAGIGFVLSVLMFACAPLVASFYHQPLLIPITQALAPTFLINGLCSQIRAQLTRHFRMTALSVAVLVAQSAGLAVGLAAALHGFGTWALVAQQITFNSLQLLLMANAARFWPGWPQRDADMAGFLRFGGNVMATSLINQLSRSLNPMLIGNRFGAELAGLYDRAFMLLMLPLNQISVPASIVALPTLSKLQDDPTRFARFLLHAQTVMLHLLSFIFAYAAAAGDVLIEVVMGAQWRPAAPLFRVLCVAGVFQTASYTINWAFVSKGLAHQFFRFSVVTRVGFVTMVLAGLHWGVEGVTVAYALGMAAMWPIGLVWLSRTSDAPALGMAKSGLRCLVAYGACGAAAFASAVMTASCSAFIRIAAPLSAMLGLMLMFYLTWRAYRTDLLAIVNTRALLRAAKPSTERANADQSQSAGAH